MTVRDVSKPNTGGVPVGPNAHTAGLSATGFTRTAALIIAATLGAWSRPSQHEYALHLPPGLTMGLSILYSFYFHILLAGCWQILDPSLSFHS